MRTAHFAIRPSYSATGNAGGADCAYFASVNEAQQHREVVVVADTTTYVPEQMIAGLGIRKVSLYVGWDDEMKREDQYDDLDAFYARLQESENLPTTSQPSVGDFEACYEPILSAGHDIVSVHIAGGISGTCDSAREAARSLASKGAAGRIEVVDGQTGAGGLGCLVLAAGSAARLGSDVDQVVDEVRRTREQLEMWFCLDTLEYLRRGGRIGAAQAMVGTALRIKPILTFGTEITPVDKVRTKSRALDRMDSYLAQLHERGATDWIVQHAQSPADAARLVDRGREIFGSDPLFCTQVGPVLGAHLGAGLLVGGVTATAG
jgi:fatty acid kinase fatty acid binding subunit